MDDEYQLHLQNPASEFSLLYHHLTEGNCQGLKVPKRDIFDRLDFPDFYTIKSLRVGDFGVKIIKKF
jgi:hypothetical protein